MAHTNKQIYLYISHFKLKSRMAMHFCLTFIIFTPEQPFISPTCTQATFPLNLEMTLPDGDEEDDDDDDDEEE